MLLMLANTRKKLVPKLRFISYVLTCIKVAGVGKVKYFLKADWVTKKQE